MKGLEAATFGKKFRSFDVNKNKCVRAKIQISHPTTKSSKSYRVPEIGFPSQIIPKILLINIAFYFIFISISTRSTLVFNGILL